MCPNELGPKNLDDASSYERVNQDDYREVDGLKLKDHRSDDRHRNDREACKQGRPKSRCPAATIHDHELAAQTDQHGLQPKSQRTNQEYNVEDVDGAQPNHRPN